MPFNRPTPDSKSRSNASGLFGAWVQAEKMMQIALLLPSAAFIGWLLGAWLDHLLHQTWIVMAGIVLGIVSGLVGAIRMAMVYGADPMPESKNGNRTKKENSDSSS